MPDNILNYVVSTAIPALLTAVDERIVSILGTAVSVMTRAATNSVDVAKQISPFNPRQSVGKGTLALEIRPPSKEASATELVHVNTCTYCRSPHAASCC
jgi:hypothetical protein